MVDTPQWLGFQMAINHGYCNHGLLNKSQLAGLTEQAKANKPLHVSVQCANQTTVNQFRDLLGEHAWP